MKYFAILALFLLNLLAPLPVFAQTAPTITIGDLRSASINESKDVVTITSGINCTKGSDSAANATVRFTAKSKGDAWPGADSKTEVMRFFARDGFDFIDSNNQINMPSACVGYDQGALDRQYAGIGDITITRQQGTDFKYKFGNTRGNEGKVTPLSVFLDKYKSGGDLTSGLANNQDKQKWVDFLTSACAKASLNNIEVKNQASTDTGKPFITIPRSADCGWLGIASTHKFNLETVMSTGQEGNTSNTIFWFKSEDDPKLWLVTDVDGELEFVYTDTPSYQTEAQNEASTMVAGSLANKNLGSVNVESLMKKVFNACGDLSDCKNFTYNYYPDENSGYKTGSNPPRTAVAHNSVKPAETGKEYWLTRWGVNYVNDNTSIFDGGCGNIFAVLDFGEMIKNVFKCVIQIVFIPLIKWSTGILEGSLLGGDLNKAFVATSWGVARSIINVVLVLALIMISFTNILRVQISNYEIKKTLPKLFIGVLLANASMLIMRFISDIAIVATGLIATVVSRATGANLNNFSDLATAAAIAPVNKFGDSILGALAGDILFPVLMLLALALCAVILFLAIILYMRTILIYFLAIVSPLAFLCYGLPGLDKYFTKWWQEFIKQSFIMPAIAGVFGLILIIDGNAFSGGNDTLILPMIMQVFLLFFAASLPTKLGGQAVQGFDNFLRKSVYSATGAKDAVKRTKDEIGGNIKNRWSNTKFGKFMAQNKANQEQRLSNLKTTETVRDLEHKRVAKDRYGDAEVQKLRQQVIENNTKMNSEDRIRLARKANADLVEQINESEFGKKIAENQTKELVGEQSIEFMINNGDMMATVAQSSARAASASDAVEKELGIGQGNVARQRVAMFNHAATQFRYNELNAKTNRSGEEDEELAKLEDGKDARLSQYSYYQSINKDLPSDLNELATSYKDPSSDPIRRKLYEAESSQMAKQASKSVEAQNADDKEAMSPVGIANIMDDIKNTFHDDDIKHILNGRFSSIGELKSGTKDPKEVTKAIEKAIVNIDTMKAGLSQQNSNPANYKASLEAFAEIMLNKNIGPGSFSVMDGRNPIPVNDMNAVVKLSVSAQRDLVRQIRSNPVFNGKAGTNFGAYK